MDRRFIELLKTWVGEDANLAQLQSFLEKELEEVQRSESLFCIEMVSFLFKECRDVKYLYGGSAPISKLFESLEGEQA